MSTVSVGDLLVKYKADVSDLTSKVKSVKSELSSVGANAESSGKSIKKTGEGAKEAGFGCGEMVKHALAFAAVDEGLATIGGALGFLKEQTLDVIGVTEKHAFVAAQTVQVLKSTKDVSGETTASLNDMADALSQTTDFSHDTVQGGENLLLTFTNIGKSVFPQATQAILDVSQSMGQDLKSSAIQVGKALGDPLTGMTALQRIGVTFSATEKEQIKTMMAHHDVIGAQKVILKELGTEFGGSATAAANTFGGTMQKLKNTFEDVKIKIGTALMPILTTLGGWFTSYGLPIFMKLVNLLTSNVGPAFKTVGDIIGNVMKYLQGPAFAGVIADFQTLGNQIGNILGPAVSQIGPMLMGAFNQIGPLLTGTIIPAVDNLVFGLGNFLLWMQGADPWVQVIKDGLLAIGLAFAGMKLAMFLRTLPALIGQLVVWATAQWTVAAAAIATALPYIAIGALVALVVFGIIMAIQHWAQILKWLGNVWKTVSTAIGNVFSALGSIIHSIINGIISWFNNLAGIFKVILAIAIATLFPIIVPIVAIIAIVKNWAAIMAWFASIFSGVGSFINSLIDSIGSAFSGLGSLISGVWNGIVGDIKQAINWIIGLFNGFIVCIDSIGINIGPVHIHPNIPQIPYLASGGYIESTGLAMVHAGESVVPARASSGGVGAGQTFVFEFDRVAFAQAMSTTTDQLVRLKLGPGWRSA